MLVGMVWVCVWGSLCVSAAYIIIPRQRDSLCLSSVNLLRLREVHAPKDQVFVFKCQAFSLSGGRQPWMNVWMNEWMNDLWEPLWSIYGKAARLIVFWITISILTHTHTHLPSHCSMTTILCRVCISIEIRCVEPSAPLSPWVPSNKWQNRVTPRDENKSKQMRASCWNQKRNESDRLRYAAAVCNFIVTFVCTSRFTVTELLVPPQEVHCGGGLNTHDVIW